MFVLLFVLFVSSTRLALRGDFLMGKVKHAGTCTKSNRDVSFCDVYRFSDSLSCNVALSLQSLSPEDEAASLHAKAPFTPAVCI